MFNLFLSLFHATAEPNFDSSFDSLAIPMIYTGNRHGVSTERYYFPSIDLISEEFEGQNITVQSSHHVMVQGDWLLFSTEKTVKGTLDFLDGQEIGCQRTEDKIGWKKEFESIFFWSETQELTALGEPQTYHVWNCRNEFEKTAILISENENMEMSWNWSDFEFRPSVHVFDEGQEKLVLVGRSLQELSRTAARIKKEQKWYPNTIFVDAGSFVGGSTSVKPNGLSLHRPLEYDILEQLKPIALGIGETELILGLHNFQNEIAGRSLPYVATNLREKKETVFSTSIQTTVEDNGKSVNIAFLGILDPKWNQQLPILALENVEITDPVQAIEEEVDRLMTQEDHPDVIIILTTAGSSVLEAIRHRSHGVDLLLGDSSMATFRVQNRKIELLEYDRRKIGAPLTLPMDGLSTLHFTVGEGVQSVSHQTIFIREDFPIDAEISTTITQNRMQYYPIQDSLLLSPKGKGWKQQISQQEWEQVVCQKVKEETGADTVLLRQLPRVNRTPGILTKKQLSDSLAIMDVVELHRIPGKSFQHFLDQSKEVADIACGAEPGTSGVKINGRSIDADQVYVVATTDQTRLSSDLRLLLPAHQSRKVWDRPNTELQKMDNGEYLSLRQLVLSGLEKESVASIDVILDRKDAGISPELLFRVNDFALVSEGFRSPQDERYTEVPESMLNNPSSSTKGAVSDVALEYYAENFRADVRYQASFSKVALEADEQEAKDDWKLSTSVTLPGKYVKTGGIRWAPYSEMMFDSEFTPQELDDGTFQSKQSDLSLTAGFSSLSWKIIQNIKLGVLANRDLAQLEEKPTEYGGKLVWTTKKTVASYLIWTTGGTLNLYANTPDDDASDLRWRLAVDTKFTLPLSRYFGVSLYGNTLGVQGRTSVNDEAIFAWNMGVSFDVLGVYSIVQ